MRVGHKIDSAMLDALSTLGEHEAVLEISSVRVSQLRPGMVLRAEVRSRTGHLLLGQGQEITPSVIVRLQGFEASSAGVVEPLSVTFRSEG